ncbi:MAG: adenine deaminase [Salibacteraceae bacterium]
MKHQKVIKSNLVDIINREVYPAAISVTGKVITAIERINEELSTYIMPGFVDAHIHVESSMLVPSEFARLAVVHGTVATVSDPHEIANVLGLEGVKYMIQNGREVPFHFFFGASPCVPATPFETAGDEISVKDLEELLQMKDVKYVSEMMNWPGVLNNDPDVYAKIELAKKYGKPVDGHAPGLKGEMAKKYIDAGISTDHECFTQEEAIDKLSYGMKVQIRQGSAARNFDALYPLINEHFENMMFCSDDKHPDDLERAHINELVKNAVAKGQDVFKVLQMACINPVNHYKLEVGQLNVGDVADFIEVNNLTDFKVMASWVEGKKVAENGKSFIESVPIETVNKFRISPIELADLSVLGTGQELNVIEVLDGELVTNKIQGQALLVDGKLQSNTETDILKMVVLNRYEKAPPAIAFIKNFGLKSGAIAGSVAHDSHNIIAVGVEDEAILKAINGIIENRGGLSICDAQGVDTIALPVAGLMSNQPAEIVSKQYELLSERAIALGSTLRAPYMSLSFMALLVIPSLKLSDKGLFDGDKFEFVSLEN